MKQKYMKPELAFERFTLTQSIASGCGVPGGGNDFGRPTQWSGSTCIWDFNGIKIFLSDAPICQECDIQMVPGGDYCGMCYNNPEGMISLFGS